MYELVKTLAALLLSPLPLVVMFLMMGLAIGWLGWRRLGGTIAGGAVLLLLLASWSPVADRWLGPMEARYPAVDQWLAGEEIRAVVVLGAAWQPDRPWPITSQLNTSSALRLMEGVRLWRQQPEVVLAVTGASRRASDQPVAHGYAEAAREFGVPRERLLVLDTPTDTGQEAQAVREVLGEGTSLLLVTSASHMPRAMAHFQAVGLAPIAAPTHYLAHRGDPDTLAYWVPSSENLRKSERALYETLGMIATRWEW
ncbi:YdcF family protein [Halomonas sp. TRM85114]|uniref:ElyC/SanA/YdcF family protein n=1 Tax=Halomonas jincaotanensis TaxID=2810616 RepID=UPI001BD61524|nr:ElyC/SanA/YdcF family protein [Halomonas jincaotanensis]MBS9404587.1 YdcF family protein [Halomonas jincaotanensis]